MAQNQDMHRLRRRTHRTKTQSGAQRITPTLKIPGKSCHVYDAEGGLVEVTWRVAEPAVTKYRFVWSSFCGYPLQIRKGEMVEALRFGARRSVLIRTADGRLFITDRYALRKLH